MHRVLISFQFLQSAVDTDIMKFFQKEFGLTDEEAKTDPAQLYHKVYGAFCKVVILYH